MGPGDGGVVGEGEEEPERGEGAFVAGGKGMRRSEEARVSEEAVSPRELGMSHPPPIRVMLWGPRTGASGQSVGLCVRQLGSQALLFAPQRVIVSQRSQRPPWRRVAC